MQTVIMAQSVPGESPPGVGGGDSYFKYKRRTVRPTDSYEHPRMGLFKEKEEDRYKFSTLWTR